MNVQWYPGHMTKARRGIEKDIALVDAVIELLDARIPQSSQNPDIAALTGNKKRVVVLNKSDLADESTTDKWKKQFEKSGLSVVRANATSSKGTDVLETCASLLAEKTERYKEKGRNIKIRAVVLGVPNVGKSTLINKYAGRTAAAAADRPGVTRGRQWIKIRHDFELLDTPGILWPKFDDREAGLKLAFTGAVKDTVIDMIELSWEFIGLIRQINPQALKKRYNIDFSDEPCEIILEKIAVSRGFLLKGGIADIERAATTLMDEFRGGKLGRITLDYPKSEQSLRA